MMEFRWWDSNPHGFPNDFESFASAIPPHRLIFNFETLVPVSEDWRDVQEGCKKSCFDKLSKFNEYSQISRTDTENHEADFESTSSAIPTHRQIFNFRGHWWMLLRHSWCPKRSEFWKLEGCSGGMLRFWSSAVTRKPAWILNFLKTAFEMTQGILSPPRLPFRHTGISFCERFLLYRIPWVKSRGSFTPFLKSSRPAQNT